MSIEIAGIGRSCWGDFVALVPPTLLRLEEARS